MRLACVLLASAATTATIACVWRASGAVRDCCAWREPAYGGESPLSRVCACCHGGSHLLPQLQPLRAFGVRIACICCYNCNNCVRLACVWRSEGLLWREPTYGGESPLSRVAPPATAWFELDVSFFCKPRRQHGGWTPIDTRGHPARQRRVPNFGCVTRSLRGDLRGDLRRYQR